MRPLRVSLFQDFRPLLFSSSDLKSSDIVLFPELVEGGYKALRQGASPHHLNDKLLLQLRQATRGTPQYVLAGSLFLKSGRTATNSSLVFHNGRVIHRYDKVHMFRPTGDHRFFAEGSRAGVFSMRFGSLSLMAGIAICFDLRFPELIRLMAIKGMRILFVPARWPRARNDAWFSLLKARAIENQSFVIGCNAKGPEGGSSYAFDPLGSRLTINMSGNQRDVGYVLLDTAILAESRRMYHAVKEARFVRRLVRQ